MEHDEAVARMQEIQRIMERTTLYTLLPGVPAIIGGIVALVGCGISYAMIGSVDFAQALSLPLLRQAQFLVMWAAVGGGAIALDLAYTAAMARRQGTSLVARPGKLAALSLTPSVFVAGVITLKLLLDGTEPAVQAIAPIWMMCYGTGVYAAGLFSLRLPRILGIAFILAGAAGMFWLADYGLLLVAISFGCFHVVFGLLVVRRTRRSRDE